LTVHVIGAGLAGLSAAVELAAAGERVQLIEASAQAGGRCRSYHDPVLEMTLDNGNHLVLSGNRDTFAYLGRLGAADRLVGPREAVLDFHDLTCDLRWTLRPNAGPLAWWILSRARRVPGSHVRDYARLAGLFGSSVDRPIEATIPTRGPLWDRLVEPFLLAALNTEARQGSSRLAAAVVAESLARGGRAYRPRVAQPNLSAAFIDPALAFLKARGGRIHYASPVRRLEFEGERVRALVFGDGEALIGRGESVVLAAPAWIAPSLVPGLEAPEAFNAIVNAHFKIAPPPGLAPIVGVIGGAAQWIFSFEDRLSVTVSAADDLADIDREALARRLWADIAKVHGLGPEPPPWRIVKERRATFAATPEQNARRPGARTRWANLFLAGDWTATGLPATIEGAIRSGKTAASHALTFAGKA
jgi:squalene-associated FAD-dependent desaturase